MSTVLGDFLIQFMLSGDARPVDPANVMIKWPAHVGAVPPTTVMPSSTVSIMYSGDMQYVTALEGGRGGLALAREPERQGAAGSSATVAKAAINAWLTDPTWQPVGHRGRYVFVFWDAIKNTVVAFTDGFRSYPVFYAVSDDRILIASDLRLILAASTCRPEVDRRAIYHYLNFAYIPSPHSAIKGISKLPPGHRLGVDNAGASIKRVFDVTYAEDLHGNDQDEAVALRDKIVNTVRDYYPGEDAQWGTFLSGGTDSSSISGILARTKENAPVDSFSIGFAEAGYDEMSYSRIAAKYFGLRSHELNVDEAAAVSLVPRLVTAFDEPFGNSSAIPTFYCADLARKNGKQMLVAGDGGDEVFGGNERYAKDQVFGFYHRLPSPIKWLGTGLARVLGLVDFHLTNRIKNMIHRGAMPNPDRFYSDDSFASDHFQALLSDEFRAAISVDDSLQIQRDLFAEANTKSELHRLMYLDLKLTIAESDVVKVVRATTLAGIDVTFPYLDRSLVDYAGRLPDQYKVRKLKKRYLFMMAMVDILPIEIREKKKQGFGLPVAVWLRRGGAMRNLANDIVLSERALSRGYFNREFVKNLFLQHERGSWDYSSEIFRLLMLELWHREYMDQYV
jgi:asparagine synthase (glutamine-hydrolysing)